MKKLILFIIFTNLSSFAQQMQTPFYNFSEKKGYVIDKDGTKINGNITINFIDTVTENTGGSILSLGGGDFGKSGKIKFIDENGKKQKESFKSKNGTKFCVQVDSLEICFLGLKTSGNEIEKASQMSKLSFDTSMFYQTVFEKDGVYLLQEVKSKNFIIKTPKQEKGMFINNELGFVKEQKIIDYLNCEGLVANSENLYDKSGIIKLLELYATKCK